MFLFPFSRVKLGLNIIIYGAGNIGKQYVKQMALTEYCNVIAVADRSVTNINIGNIEVREPDSIDFSSVDAVVIAIEAFDIAESVRNYLIDKGVKEIVWDIISFDGADYYMHQKEYVSYSIGCDSANTQKLSSVEFFSLKRLLNCLKISKYDGMSLVRVGGDADGGYVMDDSLKGSIAYSIGIGDEISWDKDMADRGYDLYMYDFTVDRLPFLNERFHFLKKGISGSKTEDSRFLTLEEAITSNCHDESSGMILKMDIEGGEWDFFDKVDEKTLSQFDQLVFEIHGLLKTDRWVYYAECLGRLRKAYSLIHIHANNCSRYGVIDGLRISDCMELTYVRNGNRVFEFDDSILPRNTDRPNIAGLDETDLGRWNSLIDRISCLQLEEE